ncbi:DEAD/DEAH box helicase family protein [Nitrosomonas sp. Is37]|uniref:type I restriction endonuclease subunit R n=1 Tax=Nitrosomonas sp. Is37 TaxID=3080535 RepID=UPI00294AF19B|nr:DEAD/DEAH box helicase family protein [Nitrosomonas sp. Is37]MDV6345292.1 DEAD/DEAH box helicase family protein [Nitrosomonas sp. Is37]
MTLNEAQTRQRYIDSQLAQAGWGNDERTVIEEFELGTKQDRKSDYIEKHGFVDYVLLGKDGKPLALVEAKRTSRDALVGKRQAADYADQILGKFGIDPFIFLTNGQEIMLWDRDRYPPRHISGFFTREDLERLLHQKRYTTPLAQIELKPEIAGRLYQIEAIRRVTEAIDKARRKFLLVMSTGTGKTRTVIALMDALLRSRRVQRILFLADRRELVRQAMRAIKEHLPHESLARIEGGDIPTGARIQIATYPSMVRSFDSISPGYYDLIIADESHRSIYNRYKAIFDHFDALQLGLTATPTDFIDHNTFDLFGCEDGIPTFNYSYEQAIAEDYLVPYRVLHAQTSFQVSGIHGEILPANLQQKLIEQGIDLEELDFEGTDIEKTVTNIGTNDALVREFMDKCRKDVLGLPVKSIIFATSHDHAKRLYQSFNKLFPDYQRRGLAEIIDSHMERAEETLDDFKFKNMPRVAISVDMLDTGIDVPAIQTLMFAKPVFSRVKFWQMIGRGTRLYKDPKTGEQKTNFLIVDCWNNFEYFQLNPEGEADHPTEPLPVRLFRLRLEKQALLRSRDPNDERVTKTLQAMLSQLPLDNINIRLHREEITNLTKCWPLHTAETERHLTQAIAPLLRYTWTASLPELQFRIICERIAVALLSSNESEVNSQATKVREAVANLADNIDEVKAVMEQRAWVLSDGFWVHLDFDRLDMLQETFAPLMRFRQRERDRLVELNLPDQITSRHWIIYGPSGEGAFAESYREQVEAWVRTLVDSLPALIKLKYGGPLTDNDIEEIAQTLNQADLFVTEDILRKVYQQPGATLSDFLSHILGITKLPSQEEKIKVAFDHFIAEHGYMSASQINFLRAVRAAVLRHHKLTHDQLKQPPLSRLGSVESLFPPKDIDTIIDFANKLVDEVA